jgi:hypothetical protein
LALPASQIGLGVAAFAPVPMFLSVFDSGGTLLESHVFVATGANIYAVITRPFYDISRIEIRGPVAADDLQFNTIPAPGAILLGSIGVGLVSWLRRRRTL